MPRATTNKAVLCRILAATFLPLAAARADVVTIQQYEAIVEPVMDAANLFLYSTASGSIMAMNWEAQRLDDRGVLEGYQSQVDSATARAITTQTIKDFKIALKNGTERARAIAAKLARDIAIYERRYSRFLGAGYTPPADPANPEAADWPHYQAIRKALESYEFEAARIQNGQETKQRIVLKDIINTLDARIDAVNRKVLEVLQRLTKVDYALTHLNPAMGFLKEPLASLQEATVGVETMALDLFKQGHTPKEQVRIIFGNYSTNLLFHIQIATPGQDGEFRLRPDSMYPIPLGPRGPEDQQTRRWLPIQPGDRVIVRALTMGPHRNHILRSDIRGQQVRLDLNSLSRGPYYLGYEAQLGARVAISRWFPVREAYLWNLTGGWAPGGGASRAEISSTDGKTLRGFGPPLVLEQDRLEWTLPKEWDAMRYYTEPAGFNGAEVAGGATIEKHGPRVMPALDKTDLSEDGSGKFAVLLQIW